MQPKKSDVADIEQNLKRILESPCYRLAEEDLDFLKSDYGRESRVLAEYTKVERALEDARVVSTVIVFGSARIKSPKEAEAMLKRAEQELADSPNEQAKIAAHAQAKTAVEFSKYYQSAREFTELVAHKNNVFNEEINKRGEIRVSRDRHFVICTGGGPGVMEAANRGAYDVGEASVGLNIKLPFEQAPNPFISSDLCFNFHYFSIRKHHFLLRAKALACFPGGFGTFDELFETLTLCQTGKMQKLPIILFGKDFWDKVVNFQYLVDVGMICPKDLELFHYAETAEEGWKIIEDFYKDAEKNA
ncbi:MAG: LOG family protein [Thermoguttaceae bacterium]